MSLSHLACRTVCVACCTRRTIVGRMRSGVAVVSACAVKSIYWLNEASTSSEERPCHICTGTGLTPSKSAPGPGSRLPHLHRDRAHACHICTGTGLTPAKSAPGPGSRLPHLHRDRAHACHICMRALGVTVRW